tara:strand:+ start:431 stop:1285 length:855 start_codon:yes stop_codon:yes gene_type:complete
MIYLYGDSFVENEKATSLGMQDHERWYQMLSKNLDEEHDNHGKCGEGPPETLSKFHRHYEQECFGSNPKFVFVLSSTYRIPWTWLEGTTDSAKNPNNKRSRKDSIDPSSAYQDWMAKREGNPELAEYYYTPEEEFSVTSLYESMWDELDHQNLKNVTYLHALSKLNNWPMIVFRVWGMTPNPFSRVYKEELFDFTILNDDLFHFYSSPLFDHSKKEWVDEIIHHAGMINHFTHRNHIVLSNIMTNHFNKTDLPTKFHEHFIRDVESGENRHDPDPNKLVDFIYE